MKKKEDSKVRVSHRFILALAVVSILSFLSIVSYTLFDRDISKYIESMWMIIIGGGLIAEANLKKLKTLEKGLTSNNFTHLTTMIIGGIAITAGILSFPSINFQNPSFLAIKGIVSIIAIIFIVIQTWVAK
ncbi:MAG: hypothetical protein ABH811_00085 [archaeon]